MLGRCYKAELTKLAKGKGIYITLVAIVVIVIMLGVFANMMDFDNVQIEDETGQELFFASGIYGEIKAIKPEDYTYNISLWEMQLELLHENSNKMSKFYDMEGILNTKIALVTYLVEHPEVNIDDVVIPSNDMMSIGESAYNFLWYAMIVVSQIVTFYAVIVMSNLLALEHKDGTLKMQILRPNSRNAIFTSKWLATMTMSFALLVFGMLISIVYAASKYGFGAKDILCTINNSQVFIMDESVFALLELLFSTIAVFAMTMFSSFMCTITKYNRSASLAIPVIVLLLGNMSSMLLQVVYLGLADFMYNLNLTPFLMPQGATFKGSSLYTAIPILLSYIAVFTTVSYIKFNRTEL